MRISLGNVMRNRWVKGPLLQTYIVENVESPGHVLGRMISFGRINDGFGQSTVIHLSLDSISF